MVGTKPVLRGFIEEPLKGQINRIWTIAAKGYHEVQTGDGPNCGVHCLTVEENIGKLILNEDGSSGFSELELFILSAAACLHDIGRVIEDGMDGWEDRHDLRSKRIIHQRYGDLGLDKGQGYVVGCIVGVHESKDMTELPNKTVPVGNDTVHLEKIAAVLCLADILDTTYQRIPELAIDVIYEDGEKPPKVSAREAILGWDLDQDRGIRLFAVPDSKEWGTVYKAKYMLEEEVAKISVYLKTYGLPSEISEFNIGTEVVEVEFAEKAVTARPFPGMAPYTREEVSIFEGREEEIDKLVTYVHANPITLLIGESGAGKTSLIQAGIFPVLDKISWECVLVRPFADITIDIKNVLYLASMREQEPEVYRRSSLLESVILFADRKKPKKILLAFDQFEDILKEPQIIESNELIDFLIAVYSKTTIPNVAVIVSFREDAFIKLSNKLFKRISGSARTFPSVELEFLNRTGAEKALTAGLRRAGIGLDPRCEEGQIELLDTILNDLGKSEEEFYPPHVQMVAEALCQNIDPETRTLSRETYSEKLGGARTIISEYLIKQLDDLGADRQLGEKILIELTTSEGRKARKKINDIASYLHVDAVDIERVLSALVESRVLRKLPDDEYEIIHDHLAEQIIKKLIGENELKRDIKALEEHLYSYDRLYKLYGEVISNVPFLASLYKYRREIVIKEEYYDSILATAISKDGFGWFWLQHLPLDGVRGRIVSLLTHDNPSLKAAAALELSHVGDRSCFEQLFNLLKDQSKGITRNAVKALRKLVTESDRERLVALISSGNEEEQVCGLELLSKIAKKEDKSFLIPMFDNDVSGIREAALKVFAEIAEPGDEGSIMGRPSNWYWRVSGILPNILANVAKGDYKNIVFDMLESGGYNERPIATKVLPRIVKKEDRGKIIGLIERFGGKGYFEDEVVGSALLALASINNNEDFDIITKQLTSESSTLRKYAVKAISNFNDPRGRDFLLALLKDKDDEINSLARHGLLNFIDNQDRGLIVRLLKDYPDLIFRLHHIKPEIAFFAPAEKNEILKLLQDDNDTIREFAVMELRKVATYEDKEILQRIYIEGSFYEKREALAGLISVLPESERDVILDISASHLVGWDDKSMGFFWWLKQIDRSFYCPYRASS